MRIGLDNNKVLVPSGSKIVCPRCLTHLFTVTQNIRYGEKLPPWLFEPTPGSDWQDPTKPTISRCCGVAWHGDGCLFISSKGWVPFNPFKRKAPPKKK